ncbi:luciferin 4-monooxygenase-like [Choristoneura fumiferana]|uniref:luciferin 4-monooxygenase-like n=1 Tax=Choristoneura fumiferana TaxID=7141 RepID=UPI003D15D82E
MILQGNQDLLVPAHLNFGTHVLNRLRKVNPDTVSLISIATGERITCVEFIQHTVSLSVALLELGVKKGDIIGIGSEKRNEFLPTALAIICAGATALPLELDSGRAALKHKLCLAKPNYFVCSRSFWKMYSDILQSLDFIKTFICFDVIDDIKLSINSLMSRDVNVSTFIPVFVQGHTHTALITYSSGTTGMPKAVQLTHLNCIASTTESIVYQNENMKTIYVIGEWCDVYDIYVTLKCICAGKTVVYINTIATPEAVLKCIQDYKVNMVFTASCTATYIAEAEDISDYDLSALNTICFAGSTLHLNTFKKIEKRLPKSTNLMQTYGSNETGSCTSTGWSPKIIRQGSVGKVFPGIMLKVVDVETRKVLSKNQTGEICARGPSVMKGYLGIDEKTVFDDDGFFCSGDLGYFDEDDCLYIVGRLKDVFKYKGIQVAPAEIETILKSHPDVREVCVVGRPAGDIGDLPAAFVVRQPGSTVSDRDLINFVAAEIPPHMKLRGGVQFISELPRNIRGKVLRQRLREMLE